MKENERVRIVAEMTRNWFGLERPEHLLSEVFEEAIEVNRLRGYKLEDWRLSQVPTFKDGIHGISETIVAVFRLVPPGEL